MAFVTVYLHACTIFISLTCSSSNYRYREEHVSGTCETIAARYRHMWEAIYFTMQNVTNPLTVILCYIYNQKVFSHFDPSLKLLDNYP
jgi:hypothetical protein